MSKVGPSQRGLEAINLLRATEAARETRLNRPELPPLVRLISAGTASAEQVRQSLYGTPAGYWKHFEAELEPLTRRLGDSLGRFDGLS
jgi:hypothetical protein